MRNNKNGAFKAPFFLPKISASTRKKFHLSRFTD